uniref:Septin 2 n=1 Tax=Cyprinus carpio TaxID=7962 RepID=A0A8C1WZ04_CYPCA
MSQADKMKQGQFTNPETPGYVGFANLPNQVHRKSVKKGFEFTLMVVGESGLGKSTLINSLFLTDLYPERVIPGAAEKIERTVQIEASTVEIEERGVKLRLTVVDTPGYGDAINTKKTKIMTIQQFLCQQSPLCLSISPYTVIYLAVYGTVTDLPVFIQNILNCVPKTNKILDEIDEHGIKIYHLPDAESDEDEDFKEQTRILKTSIPFAVVGSNQQIEAKGKKVRGRLYPWGVVEVENPEHNDFLKLRTMLITHMQDLQEVTQDLHYENFRSERLKRGGRLSSHGYILPLSPAYVLKGPEPEEMDKDIILQEKEAELRRMQEMIAKMQAQMQKQGEGDGDSPHL